MRRKDREMDQAFAFMVLDRCEYATLATVNPDGTPYCIPVTIAREGEDLFIHSAMKGQKLDNLRQNPRVCLTAVGDTHIPEDEFTTAYESAVVCAEAEEVVSEEEKIHALRLLCQRHVPSHMDAFEKEIQRSLFRTAVWKFHIHSITGKCNKLP